MKILIVGPQWMGGWLEGVLNPLRQLNHRVISFYYDYPNAPTIASNLVKVSSYVPKKLQQYIKPAAIKIGTAWEENMNRKLLSVAQNAKADLIFILKGETLRAETLAEMKKFSKHIISWWLDDPILYFPTHPQARAQLQYIDILFMFDRAKFQELQQLGAKQVEYLPCAFDADVYHPKQISPADIKKYQCDIGMIASYYDKRGELLNATHGFNVAVWGMGWKQYLKLKNYPTHTLRGKSLNGHQIATAYNIIKICPNAHHAQSVLGGLNMRTFEIPGAGGFQITDYVEGMEEHFEISKEIIVYQSPEHFRELAEYYLKHEDERKAIAKRGYERVIRDHTYQQRLKKIFEVLK